MTPIRTAWMSLLTLIATAAVIVTAIMIWWRGYRPARFYLLAWLVFLSTVTIFILTVFGLLPSTTFTEKGMFLGVILLTLLFSLALTDRTAELTASNQQLLQEIHQREYTEESLRLTQFAVDAASDPIFWVGADGQFLYTNKAACQALGYSTEELLALEIYNIDTNYPPEVWATHWQKTQTNPVTVESSFCAKNGQTFPVEITFTYFEFGNNSYNFVVARDIAPQRWAMEALKESEERLRHILSAISDLIYVTESNNDSKWVNRYISPTETLTGYATGEIFINRDFWVSTLVHVEDKSILLNQLERFSRGESCEVEYRLIKANGALIWVRDSGRVEIEPDTNKLVVYGVVSNITQRKHVEQEISRLFEKQKRSEKAIRKVNDELHQRIEELAALNYITQAVTTLTDLQTVLEIAAKSITELFFAYSTEISLFNETRSKSTIMVMYQESESDGLNLTGQTFPIADNLAYLNYISRGQSLTITNPQSSPLLDNAYQSNIGKQVQNLMFVPLQTRGQVIGAVAITTMQRGQQFAYSDIKLAETIAGQLAGTIENARLFSAAQQEIEERKQAEKALAESLIQIERAKREWEASVDSLPQLICLLDHQGRVLRTNKIVEYWKLMPVTAIKGLTLPELLYPNSQKAQSYFEKLWGVSWANLQQGQASEYEFKHTTLERFLYLQAQLISPQASQQTQDDSFAVVIIQDISERKIAETALQESEKRLQHIFSSISDHIYVTELTPDGRPINRYMSPTQALTGYPLKKFLNDWSFWPTRLIHPDDRAAAATQLERFAQGNNNEVEYRLIRADGEIIWVRDSGRVEKVPASDSSIVYGVVSDITERKLFESALAQARDQALAASRLKTQLLAKVSHELRTPLGVILGFAEMLEGGIYGSMLLEQKKVTGEIIESTNYLTTLVNELLDQAQLEAGRLLLNISTFAPLELMTQVESTMRIIAQNKGLSLTTQIASNVPQFISGDEARTQQILVNLVGNALKFTEQGEVKICIFLPDESCWALQVSDTGPGIPPEIQVAIFEPFHQVDGSITRKYRGYGLGLSIVKQLTELMGGQIMVDSQVGQGSVFTIQLPLQSPEKINVII